MRQLLSFNADRNFIVKRAVPVNSATYNPGQNSVGQLTLFVFSRLDWNEYTMRGISFEFEKIPPRLHVSASPTVRIRTSSLAFVVPFLRASCEKPTIYTHRNSLRKIFFPALPWTKLEFFACRIFERSVTTENQQCPGKKIQGNA